MLKKYSQVRSPNILYPSCYKHKYLPFEKPVSVTTDDFFTCKKGSTRQILLDKVTRYTR